MQKIFALAQSLGFSPPAAQQAPPPPPEPPVFPPPTPKQEASPPDDRQQALGELLQKAGKLDRRQENLLNALKPFLKPERREKIDRAMQAARISRLAGASLRGRDQKELTGGNPCITDIHPRRTERSSAPSSRTRHPVRILPRLRRRSHPIWSAPCQSRRKFLRGRLHRRNPAQVLLHCKSHLRYKRLPPVPPTDR